jgi:hypothetical protein
MSIRRPLASSAVVALALTVCLATATFVCAQSEVKVVNKPDVSVPDPIPHTTMQRFLNCPVAARTKPCASGMPAGVVDSEGYSRMMLSLGGEVMGTELNGAVGVALVPVEDFVNKAMEKGEVPFALRAEAQAIRDTGIVASEPYSLPVSFPKYAVCFYNDGDKPVKANLYVYLTQ